MAFLEADEFRCAMRLSRRLQSPTNADAAQNNLLVCASNRSCPQRHQACTEFTFLIWRSRIKPSSPVMTSANNGRRFVALLAHDEGPMRAFVLQLLQEAGFHVLVASTCHEALSYAGVHRTIDVLVAQPGMCGITGDEVALQISGKFPNMAVILISATEFRYSVDPAWFIIGRPFTTATFLETLVKALQQSYP